MDNQGTPKDLREAIARVLHEMYPEEGWLDNQPAVNERLDRFIAVIRDRLAQDFGWACALSFEKDSGCENIVMALWKKIFPQGGK